MMVSSLQEVHEARIPLYTFKRNFRAANEVVSLQNIKATACMT